MIEDITIVDNQKKASEFFSLDQLITQRDINSIEETTNSDPDGVGELEMDTEDLKLLGFHVLEQDEM